MKGENSKNIILGRGIFKVDNQPVGLTRDGGTFVVEYEYRPIEADGDRGKVKGRILKEKAIAKITINHLETLTEIEKFKTGVKVDTTTKSGSTVVTGTGKIDDTKDYHTVEFVGATKDGRDLSISITNAINLENINWDLKDKSEVLDSVTYEGTYDPEASDEYDENWKIEYKTPVVAV